MIKLVLTDMDNTLLNPGSDASDRALAAIHGLLDRGIYFGPSSGRDIESILASFRGDSDCLRTALLSNGKKVYTDGVLMNQTAVDRDSIVRMAKMVHHIPGVYVAGRGEGGEFACAPSREDLSRTQWGRSYVDSYCEPEDLYHQPIITCGIHFDDASLDVDQNEWADRIREACPKLDLVSPGHRMFDVLPHGWSKGSGVRILQILLGIDASEIVAFGDSDNDLGMLSVVGHPVAVANANDAVKSVARHHIGSCTEDSVAKALEDIAKYGEGAFYLWDKRRPEDWAAL